MTFIVVSRLAVAWLTRTLPETVLNIAGFAVVLVAALLGVLLVAKLVTKVAEMASLGWLNRVLGLAFAIASPALVLGLVFILLETLNGQLELVKSPILEESVLYGPLKDLGYTVFPYLKGLLSQSV